MPVRPPSEPAVFPQSPPGGEDPQQGLARVLGSASDSPERLVNGDSHASASPERSSNGDGAQTERSTPSAQGADPPLSPCVMTVIVQPPTDGRPAERFHSPVVVSLETRPTGNVEYDIPGNDARYWALASIARRPDGSDVLRGATTVSIRRAHRPPQHPNVGYLIFNNLSITQPGVFRIYISLVLMPGISVSSELDPSGVNGIKVDDILTNEINVDVDAVMLPPRMFIDMVAHLSLNETEELQV